MKKLSQMFGINPELAVQLEQAGIRTILDFAHISNLTDLSTRINTSVDILSQWQQLAKTEVTRAIYRRNVAMALAFLVASVLVLIGLWSYRRGLSPRYDEAIQHYNRGVALYQQGRLNDAIAEYTKALTLKPDFREAIANIAIVYDQLHDYTRAKMWYEKSAGTGNKHAKYELGLLYEEALGVQHQDMQQARRLYEEAANDVDGDGDAEAMQHLGYMYQAGGRWVKSDPAAAWQWYQKALAAYQKAASKGDADAMTELGKMYLSPQGVPQDSKQAQQWFEKAAAGYRKAANDDGDIYAMQKLGLLYETGLLGPAPDRNQALYWYRKAADAGDEDAKKRLNQLRTGNR
jgi:TPR repeat protein